MGFDSPAAPVSNEQALSLIAHSSPSVPVITLSLWKLEPVHRVTPREGRCGDTTKRRPLNYERYRPLLIFEQNGTTALGAWVKLPYFLTQGLFVEGARDR
jgi:hypothetical protein